VDPFCMQSFMKEIHRLWDPSSQWSVPPLTLATVNQTNHYTRTCMIIFAIIGSLILDRHSAPATCFLMLDWSSNDLWLELLDSLLAAGDKQKEDALCPGIRTSADIAFSPRSQLWWLTKAFSPQREVTQWVTWKARKKDNT